ncbi:MAG: hypothetical protein AB8B93_07375 [Pseudomonadales bacterium]
MKFLNGESGRARRITGSTLVILGFAGRLLAGFSGAGRSLLANDLESLLFFGLGDCFLAAELVAAAFLVGAFFTGAFLLAACFFAAVFVAAFSVAAFELAVFAFALVLALDFGVAFFAAIGSMIPLVCPGGIAQMAGTRVA